MKNKMLTLHYIQEVDMLRKSCHVCILIQYRMGWFGDDQFNNLMGFVDWQMSKDISTDSVECCGCSQGDLVDHGAYTKRRI